MIEWSDQVILKSLLQHNSKASSSVLSLFYGQLSHLYKATGKTIALTIQNFVSKTMSLLFNTLSGFVIAFIPKSRHLLISWLQSPPTVIFGTQENKWLLLCILIPTSRKVDQLHVTRDEYSLLSLPASSFSCSLMLWGNLSIGLRGKCRRMRHVKGMWHGN